MLLQPGEVLQYLIAMDASDGVGRIRLERSHNGGQRWEIVRGANGSLIDSTGTVLVPLTGTIYSGLLTNETGRKCLYRWNCVTFDLDNSDIFNWSLINAIQAATWLDRKNNVCVIVNDNEPTDGALGDGVGYAEGGSIYINWYSDPKIWFQNGTMASPQWDLFG